jgi:hypothetical protein
MAGGHGADLEPRYRETDSMAIVRLLRLWQRGAVNFA